MPCKNFNHSICPIKLRKKRNYFCHAFKGLPICQISPGSEGQLSIDQQEPINVQHNLRMEGSNYNSDQKYFPLFSKSIARSSEAKREKEKDRPS